jgi:hypothetical protein
MRSVDVYNAATDTWAVGPPMNDLRFGHGVVRVGPEMLAVSGADILTDSFCCQRTTESLTP